jgi:protocatechuate 3,4-dioxygenase beta subunit
LKIARLLCLLLPACAITASAQSNYALLTGSVNDPEHRPIAGAMVELKASSTGAVRRVVTNEHGLFEAPGLSPDEYQLKAPRPAWRL